MGHGRGRQSSQERKAVTEGIRKLLNHGPHLRKDIIRKVEVLLSEQGFPVRGLSVENLVTKAYEELKKKGEIHTMRAGKQSIWYAPDKKIEAEEYRLELIGVSAEDIDVDDKFKPLVKKWLDELPDFVEGRFGVFCKKEAQWARLGKIFEKYVIRNIPNAVNLRFDQLVLLPFSPLRDKIDSDLPSLVIEHTHAGLFGEMMRDNPPLKVMWKNFKKKSVNLWKNIFEMEDKITELVEKELEIPVAFDFQLNINSVSEKLIALLEVFAYSHASAFEYYSHYIDRLPLIKGMRIKEKKTVFVTTSDYLWTGDYFEQAEPEQIDYITKAKGEVQYHIVPPSSWETVDAFVFCLNEEDYICLSKQWMQKMLGGNDHSTFDKFCITALNHLIKDMRQGEVASMAKETYKLQEELRDMRHELAYALERQLASQ